MSDGILSKVAASPTRRWLGIGVLAALGVLVIYLALLAPPAGIAMQLLMIALGLGALWLAESMRRATRLVLELTTDELRTSDGQILARCEEMVAIDRGAFAFKPSHGFTLKLSSKGPLAWQPGMYWRVGRRLGVGGITPGAQTKIMADMIAAMIAERG